VEERGTHITLELVSLSDEDAVEVAVWGPFPTRLGDTIGETVGVVRGEGYALGLQALTLKTLGGYPWNEDDHMPQLDVFEQDDYDDLSRGKRAVLYSVEAARPTDYGSAIGAYCRNRNEARVIRNLGRERFVAPPFADSGVIGCKIALFGSPVGDALDVIGTIERAEGLPHPLLDGQWVKRNPAATAAYVILPFSETNFDRALEITERAGLAYLYHPDPFETWGTFELKVDDFPNGVEGLRGLSERAEARGVRLGVHTLSNFITTDDPYVTPVPDSRLAVVGRSVLVAAVNSEASEIPIEDPTYFVQEPDHLSTVIVGQELMRFGSVSSEPPWRLLQVTRGAHGTKAARHEMGDSIGKLLDHSYRVFLTDADLSREVAENLADLFNRAKLHQISFDGLEGNRSTGLGNYGEARFAQTWFDNLNDEIKGHYIADASRPGHFFWHMYTRMNWGEPWYAGFRESQTEYRLKNQAYFQRNYMPGMLGWFNLTANTSVEDAEWMLARSAGFDAGYGLNMTLDRLDANGVADDILRHMAMWEEARFARAFSEEQKSRMRSADTEFHLEQVGGRTWDLLEIHSHRFEHRNTPRQPGEPSSSVVAFDNPVEEQPMTILISARGGRVSGIRGELDGALPFAFDVVLEPGETLRYDGGNSGRVFDAGWQILRTLAIEPAAFHLAPGAHTLLIDATISGDDEPAMVVEIRLTGPAERITGVTARGEGS
jgi:hypothetical protein